MTQHHNPTQLRGKSLKQKLIVRNMATLLIVFVTILFFYAWQNFRSYERQVENTSTRFKRSLERTGRLLISDKQKTLRTYAEDNSFNTLRDILFENVHGDPSSPMDPESKLLVMAGYVRQDFKPVVWVTPDNPEGLVDDNVVMRDPTTQWAMSLTGTGSREVTLDGETIVQVATPIYASADAISIDLDDLGTLDEGGSEDVLVGALIYGFSTNPMKRDLAQAKSQYQQDLKFNLTVLVLVSLMALVVGFLATRRQAATITQPLAAVTAAADTIAAGNYNVEVELSTGDEIEVLAHSFNKMAQDLEKSYAELADLNKNLEAKVEQRTKELAESESKFRTLFEESADAILLGDENELFDCNPAMLRLMGCQTKDELLTMGPDDISPERQPDGERSNEKLRDIYRHVLNEGSQLFEWVSRRVDNSEFYTEIVVTGFMLNGRPVLHKVFRDITERKETEDALRKAQQRLLETAHSSGMAEIATGVLHNIGNILNSVNISTEEIALTLKNSKIKGFLKANEMMRGHADDLTEYLVHHDKGKLIPGYYLSLGEAIADEQHTLQEEINALTNKVNMMRDVISTQQNYAKASLYTEDVRVIDLIEDSLKLQLASLQKQGVKIQRSFDSDPKGSVAKVKLVHVLTNLIKNAKEAMQGNDAQNKVQHLSIKMEKIEDNMVQVFVQDNGVGIAHENLEKIFNHGFTTKANGHGFGLHTCANFMTEMGGDLSVQSDGPGKGATFVVTFPLDERGPELPSQTQAASA
ncbi:Histidine kinase [Sulfidibacter corallicola]|uniref:histidine kinase n=1 Tax=Sulfidibacter corallicola TaxID=2818388 RepID=A0A8A4TWK7_SULCO|nr:ATP-binding protein [Sulfidibacter corallicola]QTD53352.1 HAMP domain-containing protein [Sulfidibacter corallicola]